MRKYSLRSKLSFSYIFVALICVSLISIFMNLFLEKHFRDYIIRNQERKNSEVVSMVAQQYNEEGKWDSNVIENIGINALEQGMIIKVTDSSGRVIWDANEHNSGMCQRMIQHMAENMMSRYHNWKGGYTEKKYPVMYSSKDVGSVQIGYYGPFFFTDSDLAFINTLNKMLMAVGVFSFFLSLMIGALMARRLSMPISRAINMAQMISKGYFGGRSVEKSSTKEMAQLTDTINSLAETLEKQELLRKRLTSDVAHELRTPLATLQSHMEAMIDGIWKPDTERLKSCHEEITRIGRMVGDLEKLARYEGENLVLNKTEFDVSELIRHVINNFEADFVNKGVHLNFTGNSGRVWADRDKISQVLINLVSNALKYSQSGGFVEIILEDNNENISIVVKDTGIGISEEDICSIFERFYRADKSRNRMTGGAGIGLTIAKAIVEAHRGTISVCSEVNKGTEFIVCIPKEAC